MSELNFIFFRSTMLYFQSVRIHTRRDSRLNLFLSRSEHADTLLDEIREFLASDPKIDGGATILSCGDLAVRIFGLRAQRLQQMAEKIKSAYDKFL